jgi:uncharacterized protein YkwD
MRLRLPRVLAIAAAALASAGALAATSAPAQAASCGGDENAPTQYEAGGADIDASVSMLCLINDERARNGLQPVQLYLNLWGASTPHKVLADNSWNHLNDLIAHGQTGNSPHNGSDGSTPEQRMAAYGNGASYWRTGEIVVYTSSGTPRSAFDWWMNSPGHRALILDPEFNQIGVYGNGKTPGGGNGATFVGSFGVRR